MVRSPITATREVNKVVETERPQRIPVSRNRDILTTKNIPKGKVGRWVNDIEDRLLKFLQGGWEFVTDQNVTVGEKTVDASHGVGSVIHRLVGGGHTAYLMVIDKEWYEQDQHAKQNLIDELEEAMHKPSARDGTYGSVRQEVET